MKIKKMIHTSLFSALIAISAQIAIVFPFSPIPVNLALIPIFLFACLSGPTTASISVLIYILLGIAGFPVFSNFQSGISYLFNYTGGFIIGYVFLAYLTAYMYNKLKLNFFVSSLCGLIICYISGVTWFCWIYQCNIKYALFSAVIPFIPADVIKIFIAYIFLKNKNIIKIFQ